MEVTFIPSDIKLLCLSLEEIRNKTINIKSCNELSELAKTEESMQETHEAQ